MRPTWPIKTLCLGLSNVASAPSGISVTDSTRRIRLSTSMTIKRYCENVNRHKRHYFPYLLTCLRAKALYKRYITGEKQSLRCKPHASLWTMRKGSLLFIVDDKFCKGRTKQPQRVSCKFLQWTDGTHYHRCLLIS